MSGIKSPRPRFSDEEVVKGKHETLFLGTDASGVVVKVFKDRMEINGYYESEIRDGVRYSVIRKPIVLTWDELEKAKRRAVLPTKVAAALEPDYEDNPSQEYLDSLPVVTLNGNKFYIDGKRKERRPVKNPNQVFIYFKKRS
jgi:hypothetical protein